MKNYKMNGITFELNKDGTTYGVKEYDGASDTVIIPEEVDGKKVTEIHYHALGDNNVIKHVSVPDTIREVDWSGLPSRNVYLNRYGNGLYLGNDKNPYVVFIRQTEPSVLGLRIHKDCKTFLREDCHLDARVLYLPKTIRDIPPYTLVGHIGKVIIDKDNPYLESPLGSNVVLRKEDGVLIKGFSDPVIPEGVREIGYAAFFRVDLKYVTLPSTLEIIGTSAFEQSWIRGITLPSSVRKVRKYAFAECSRLEHVHLNEGLEKIGKRAFHSTYLREISIPFSVSTIGEDALSGCGEIHYGESDDERDIPVMPGEEKESIYFECDGDKEGKINSILIGTDHRTEMTDSTIKHFIERKIDAAIKEYGKLPAEELAGKINSDIRFLIDEIYDISEVSYKIFTAKDLYFRDVFHELVHMYS